MPLHSSTADSMTEAHEERIQRVEDSVTSLMVQVSEQGVELKHVSEKIDSNQQQLLSKFGEIIPALNSRLEHGDKMFAEIHKSVSQVQADIAALKGKEKLREKARAGRRNIGRKILISLVLGVAAVFTHKIGLALWMLLR